MGVSEWQRVTSGNRKRIDGVGPWCCPYTLAIYCTHILEKARFVHVSISITHLGWCSLALICVPLLRLMGPVAAPADVAGALNTMSPLSRKARRPVVPVERHATEAATRALPTELLELLEFAREVVEGAGLIDGVVVSVPAGLAAGGEKGDATEVLLKGEEMPTMEEPRLVAREEREGVVTAAVVVLSRDTKEAVDEPLTVE